MCVEIELMVWLGAAAAAVVLLLGVFLLQFHTMNNIMYSFTVTPGMISLAIELLSVVICFLSKNRKNEMPVHTRSSWCISRGGVDVR